MTLTDSAVAHDVTITTGDATGFVTIQTSPPIPATSSSLAVSTGESCIDEIGLYGGCFYWFDVDDCCTFIVNTEHSSRYYHSGSENDSGSNNSIVTSEYSVSNIHADCYKQDKCGHRSVIRNSI
ncbi:hypothetical protein LTR60_007048 [Cryomyces antarcticus]|nr:hypothetical protein LTR60_007048 [Cryomyces antarcticus]